MSNQNKIDTTELLIKTIKKYLTLQKQLGKKVNKLDKALQEYWSLVQNDNKSVINEFENKYNQWIEKINWLKEKQEKFNKMPLYAKFSFKTVDELIAFSDKLNITDKVLTNVLAGLEKSICLKESVFTKEGDC